MTKLAKKAAALSCAAVIAFACAPAVFAAQSVYTDGYALSDDADLFTESEATELTDEMSKAHTATGWQIIVHTDTYGASSDAMTSHYDDYFYSESRYNAEAVMLVFDTASGNRVILNYGSTQSYFSDSVLNDVKAAMKPYLESNDNFGAAKEFVNQMEYAYSSGRVTDYNEDGAATEKKETNRFLVSLSRWWIYLIIALIVFAAFILINRGRYKHMGKSGTYDLKKNSQLRLTDQQDVIIDRRTTYTTINTSSGSSGGSGGSGGSGSGGAHSSGSF